MPVHNVTTNVSTSTYQQCDGSNFTTQGVGISVPIGDGKIGGYLGIGTGLADTPVGAVMDINGSIPYGKSRFSGGFRVRNNINSNSQTVQFRVQPATVTIPISKDASIYTTPYVAAKVDYKSGSVNTTCGNYTGVSFKAGKTKCFVEGQIYDVAHINPSTTSINAGVSIPL